MSILHVAELKRQLLHSAFIWLAVSMVHAQEPSFDTQVPNPVTVSVNASSTEVQIAEPFTVAVEVIAPSGYQVSLPSLADSLGVFEIIAVEDTIDLPLESGARLSRRVITLETIVTGQHEVPALEIQSRDGLAMQQQFSKPVPITIVSKLEKEPDPSKFHDIRPLVDSTTDEHNPANAWIWWGAGAASLVACCLAGIMLVGRLKRPLTPVKWAEKQIVEIHRRSLDPQADLAAIIDQLSSVVRRYLQLQFGISAPAQSTDEVLGSLEQHPLVSVQQISQYKQLFETNDLAKFAGLRLSQQELQQVIQATRDLVRGTSNSGVSVRDNGEER